MKLPRAICKFEYSLNHREIIFVNQFLRFPPPNVKGDNITWLYSALAKSWTKTGLPDFLIKNITK
jgi:hypothetical protein